MREQTFQRLLKPHSCGASWRDKKLPAGGTQPKVLTGLSTKRNRPICRNRPFARTIDANVFPFICTFFPFCAIMPTTKIHKDGAYIMTYQEVMAQAKGSMGKCKACPVCNGQACRNTIPGPGAKGVGDTAIRNYDAWQRLRVNMDTLCPYGEADTAFTLFGRTFAAPIFAGPVGAVTMHYSDKYNDETYNAALVSGCAQAGIAAFTGDGLDANVMVQATKAIRDVGGVGVPTVKPWNMELIREKLALVRESGAFAVAMDVDAAGLPFLKGMNPPAGSKTVEQLRQIREAAGLPFIVKGVMTVKGALKSLEAGADAILVSNHGGRVLDGCAATAEVLPEIVAAVEGRVPVLVDGGIRTGTDVFRALALGLRQWSLPGPMSAPSTAAAPRALWP